MNLQAFPRDFLLKLRPNLERAGSATTPFLNGCTPPRLRLPIRGRRDRRCTYHSEKRMDRLSDPRNLT
jgi:hypothetical protein